MLRTVTDFAKELGITKGGVYYHLKKLPDDLQPIKENNKFYLSEATQSAIKENLANSSSEEVEKTEQSPELIRLYENQLEDNKKRIESLEKQNSDLTRLLDQQQQLQLATVQEKEQLKLELTNVSAEKKRKWWQKSTI